MNLIVIGPPGAGKGTQSKIITKELNIPHISTGDLLRDEVKKGSELGLLVKELMDTGGFVSDEQVTEILKSRIKEDDCKNGFLLDGYPRTTEQAEVLSTLVNKIDNVIVIDVPDESIISRMSGRRICQSCGRVYHIEGNAPKVSGKCDNCGNDLTQRPDDSPEVVKNRLKKYHEATSPIINFYEDKGIVFKVSGLGEIDKISNEIMKTLRG